MNEPDAPSRKSQPHPSDAAPPTAARRVVLVGASNLAIHLPVVIETARLLWGSPLDVMAALGHGRSYGMTSRVLGRVLPGILDCGLWRDLRHRSPAPTAALVTDIGNDLLYDVSVEQIAAWVDECLTRLARLAPTLIVTELPLESSQSLTSQRFLLLRTIFFPRCRLTLEETLTRSSLLNARVRELAAQHRATVIKPSRAWYGFDPIHIRRTRGSQVWREILASWSPDSPAQRARWTSRQWISMRRLRPLERQLWGRLQHQPQPAGYLADGTAISLY